MAKLLLDSQIDFDVVHNEKELEQFDTVILPDCYQLNESMGAAFDAFVKKGGKVLMLGGSGLKENGEGFAFDVPFAYRGKSAMDVDYFQLAKECEEDIVASPILCYRSAHKVEGEGEILARVKEPMFSRTYGKYCSHCNTPYGDEYAAYPAALKCGNVLYVAHELAAMYADCGVTYHRRYFKWLLRKLYQADAVEVNMPSQSRIHFVKREKQDQYVLHLMYASPVQRGNTAVLEDFPTLRDTKVTVHVPEAIKKVSLMPQNTELDFAITQDGCTFTVPEVTAHQMVVLEF